MRLSNFCEGEGDEESGRVKKEGSKGNTWG